VKNLLMAAAGAVLVVAGIAGCSSSPKEPQQPAGALPPNTAHVTINGKDAGTSHDLVCGQQQFLHMIQTANQTSGFTAMIELGPQKPVAKSVQIQNLGGFTGSFGPNVGKADASVLGNTFKINGTAQGNASDQPPDQLPKAMTATFEIKVNC
jgi:ipoprotein LpqH